MRINTNVMAINAQRNLDITSVKMSKALEKLSSGLRINRSADDAAGLAISEKMRSLIRGLTQGARNGQDGISMIQTAEGALSEVHGLVQRMRELSVQAGNSTLSASDRTAIGEEMLTLRNEIDNIAARTKFNGLNLLTGSLSTALDATSQVKTGFQLTTTAVADVSSVDVSKLKSDPLAVTTYTLSKINATTLRITQGGNSTDAVNLDGTIGVDGSLTVSFNGVHTTTITIVGAAAKTVDDTFTDLNGKTIVTAIGNGSATYRVGAEASDTISVAFDDMRASAIGTVGNRIATLVVDNTNVSTVAKANILLASLDQAIQDVSTGRAKLGAAQNQIEAAVNSLGVVAENLSASESRIRDADIAKISSELVARQIMQQAGVSVLSQANSSSQSVLALLQNR